MDKKYEAFIYDEKPGHPFEFAVHFQKTLPFPDDGPTIKDCEQLAVCAAIKRGGIWSWNALGEGNQKDAVGQAMLDHGCEVAKWYWCVMVEIDATEGVEK